MRRLGFVVVAVLVSFAAACAGRGGSGTVPALQPHGAEGSQDRLVMISRRVAVDAVTGIPLRGMLPRPISTHDLVPDPSTATPTPPPPPLGYYGGPVQTSPKMYFVFWGSQWLSSTPGAPATATGPGDPDNLRQYAKNFTTAAAGSRWLNDVLQYTQTGGLAAGNPVTMRLGSWTDTTSAPPALPTVTTQIQLNAEALKAAKYFGAAGINVNIVIFLPHGVGAPNYLGNPTPGPWCAYHTYMFNAHSVIVPYTVLPYLPDIPNTGLNCGVNAVNNPGGTNFPLDGVSIILGHEIAEILTDPQITVPCTGPGGPNDCSTFSIISPTAWDDFNNEEVGDKCEWIEPPAVGAIEDNPYVGNFPTQSLWDNSHVKCRQGPAVP